MNDHNSQVMQWMLCALWMVVTAAGGFFLSHTSSQIDLLWKNESDLMSRVSRDDALIVESKERSLEMKHDIEVVNGKLDTLLERVHSTSR